MTVLNLFFSPLLVLFACISDIVGVYSRGYIMVFRK